MIRLQTVLFSILLLGVTGLPATAEEVWSLDGFKAPESVLDVESGQITGTWPAEGAQFLNDPAIDEAGRVFASDMLANRSYVLDNDALSVWFESEDLLHPNGLRVEDGRLLVAGWGRDISRIFRPRHPAI
ncbi:hypothetical protein [Mesorhizobium sp.]|uniref:hypothetical protein n=1 Tax=Mesorhizobium sp. TaxID=1871066 RepID=UPI000FE3E274|nr:hypothetical protein [Mesorhizobium sp.]RWO00115.1 MAG: hypothetical protein EOS06_16380 [Mesorhizobium sp.]